MFYSTRATALAVASLLLPLGVVAATAPGTDAAPGAVASLAQRPPAAPQGYRATVRVTRHGIPHITAATSGTSASAAGSPRRSRRSARSRTPWSPVGANVRAGSGRAAPTTTR